LLFGSVAPIIKDICVFLSGNHRCIKVFKLLVHLGIGAYLAVLFKSLYYYNLLLLEGLSCFEATAFYEVSVEFPLGYCEILREE